ncbi:MAG: hypothetical protein OHK0029_31000 [Armatimonadaceae bacterium]
MQPIGDRLSYDLVFDVHGALVKVQVKHAWFDALRGNYVVDTRRTKTNRRKMLRSKYCVRDFDFALVYIADIDVFYIFPVQVFTGYASEIHMVESDKRQRKPRSVAYRDAWHLIERWAACRETDMCLSVEFGEAPDEGNPEPSPEFQGRCRDCAADT